MAGGPEAGLQAAPQERHGQHSHDRPQGQHGNPQDLDGYIAAMEDPSRAEWQKPDEVMRALAVGEGQTACDIGAGPGYFALRLARAVSPRGFVFAVDVEPRMLGALGERLASSGTRNVAPVLGLPGDPLLPASACDLALIVDTYHHFPDGPAYLKRLAGSLKPGGRIANVDFHKRATPVGPPVEHRVAREDFLRDAERAGLAVAAEHTFLPYQYFVVLSPAAEGRPQYVSPAGRRFYSQPDAQGQVAEARRKLDADPGNVALLAALGDAHAAVWDHGQAIRAYDRAFELGGGSAALHQQRGHRYLSIRAFDKARADLEKAVSLDEKLGGAWYYLGLLEYLAGRFDKAAAAYEKNLALLAGDVARGIAAMDWLYMSYRRGGQDEKARRLLDLVTPELKVEGNPRLYLNRLLFYKGLKTEAELLAGTPSDIELTTLLYGIGNFHLYGGDRDGARAAFAKAVGTGAWPALAFIAAENDLAAMR